MKNKFSLTLIVVFLFGIQPGKIFAQNDMPPPPGAPPMPAGGFPEGMPPPPPFNLNPHEKAAVYIDGGLHVKENEMQNGVVALSFADGAKKITNEGVDGFLMTSSDYNATGIVVKNGNYKIGGEKDYYTVVPNLEKDYVGTKVASQFDPSSEYNFNSVLLFSLDENVPKDAETGSSGIDAANDGGKLFIENAYLQVDGAQRYVSSTFGDAVTVINDSYLVSTGDANGLTTDVPLPFSNAALLISGSARTNFTISTSHTYYNNSTVVAEGWASLSTDAASGDGLDLYAYNTKAYALNGGYATYADFTCRVWSYGSYLEAAEVGGILSKSGEIYIMDGGSAAEDVLKYNTGATTNNGSHVKAGRNALMIHAPDMMGEGLSQVDHGVLKVVKSTLETTDELKSTFDYSTLGEDVAAYVDYIKGDVILIKSTSATINLEEAILKSSNGVLFHTVLNSDKFGNFLKVGDNDVKDENGNTIVKPILLTLSNMSAEGDILHDDYQRNMQLNLLGTNLTGKVNQGTHESWVKTWSDKGITEAQWLPNEKWDGSNELSVSLDGTSIWTVTETSAMSNLAIAEGAKIIAPKGCSLTMTVDGKAAKVMAGNYEGLVVLTVSKN